MTHLKSIMLASAIAVLPLSVNALSVTVIDSSTQGTQGDGNQAHVFAGNFGANLLGGTWESAPAGIMPAGTTAGSNKSPWENTPVVSDAGRTYFSVGPGSGSAPSIATLRFTSLRSSFLMLWGSIDSYNKIEFFIGETSQGSLTGTQLVDSGNVDGCEAQLTPTRYECVAKVRFDVSYDNIKFSSNAGTGADTAAFEFATVPLPAALWLLLGVSGALVAAKRRSVSKAA